MYFRANLTTRQSFAMNAKQTQNSEIGFEVNRLDPTVSSMKNKITKKFISRYMHPNFASEHSPQTEMKMFSWGLSIASCG